MPNTLFVLDTRKKPAPVPPVPPEPSAPGPYTLRFKFSTPNVEPQTSDDYDVTPQARKGTWTEVDASQGIWDWTYENSDWSFAFDECSLIYGEDPQVEDTWEVIAAGDTSGVTNCEDMFNRTSINGVCLFDTSNVTNICEMLANCSIETIPDFNVSSVTLCVSAFAYCYYVESGITSMYTKLSSLGAQVEGYDNCFYSCGSSTETGAAELAQIPTSWGGTLS